MNITKLNLSDESFQELVNCYLKILIYAVKIDGSINEKEVKIIFSLLTRVDIEDDNKSLWKLNFFNKKYSFKNKVLSIDDEYFNYLRVFDLENIIFYEWEKSLHLILSNFSKSDSISIDYDKMLKKLEKYLENIKNIIESKRKILWDDYIKIFYYWIYFYSKVITKQSWPLFWKKVVKEEKKFLELIEKVLEIDKEEIKESLIEKIRTPILDI